VYEYITFEQAHISVHHRPKLWNRSISISSFGKSFHITGWKIGYAIAPEHLMNEIKKVHQFLVFSVNSISQRAISEYLDIVNVNDLGNFYQQKRDFFKNLLIETKLELLPCEGTYFQVASYAKISGEDDVSFTKRLLTEYGVATIPISTFYENKKDTQCIRFCFAKDDETLVKAAECLMKL
jgi:methionine aminotransferase